MVFVHVTTSTINNAPVENLILDAAKETPTTLKLSHNAGKYVKVSVFFYSCSSNIWHGTLSTRLRLIFSRLYKTYNDLRHSWVYRIYNYTFRNHIQILHWNVWKVSITLSYTYSILFNLTVILIKLKTMVIESNVCFCAYLLTWFKLSSYTLVMASHYDIYMHTSFS